MQRRQREEDKSRSILQEMRRLSRLRHETKHTSLICNETWMYDDTAQGKARWNQRACYNQHGVEPMLTSEEVESFASATRPGRNERALDRWLAFWSEKACFWI